MILEVDFFILLLLPSDQVDPPTPPHSSDQVHARQEGICQKRRELYSQCFDEVFLWIVPSVVVLFY